MDISTVMSFNRARFAKISGRKCFDNLSKQLENVFALLKKMGVLFLTTIFYMFRTVSPKGVEGDYS